VTSRGSIAGFAVTDRLRITTDHRACSRVASKLPPSPEIDYASRGVLPRRSDQMTIAIGPICDQLSTQSPGRPRPDVSLNKSCRPPVIHIVNLAKRPLERFHQCGRAISFWLCDPSMQQIAIASRANSPGRPLFVGHTSTYSSCGCNSVADLFKQLGGGPHSAVIPLVQQTWSPDF